MSDCPLDEVFATFNSFLCENTDRLRAAGEPEPVALFATGADGVGRALLAELGWADTGDAGLAGVVVLPKAAIADLLDRHVRPGVGSHLLGLPVPPGDAVRVLFVSPGRLDLHFAAFAQGRPVRLASALLDLDRQVLRLNTAGGSWDTVRVAW